MRTEIVGRNGISAKVVADSQYHSLEHRITTLQLRYHRYIHSEFMTHRLFSRSASSSRAIPISKIIQQVVDDPAIPVEWGKNQSGMQAKEILDESTALSCQEEWLRARDSAVEHARNMTKLGLHKQIVNRVLEPWQYIHVIMTATEWDNFFALRDHPDAQPEIQELARCMKKAIQNSIPKFTFLHAPYVNEIADREATKKCCTARCARVSYKNHDGTDPSVEKDFVLHDDLLSRGHWSPFEHCAEAAAETKQDVMYDNFRGWRSYRHELKMLGEAR